MRRFFLLATILSATVVLRAANGSTTLGGGWNTVPLGLYAENALAALIVQGQVEGPALVQALIDHGYGDRGPAYYAPGQHGPGAPPFYAFGNPHDYAALDNGVWDLIGFDVNLARPSPSATAIGSPAPVPSPPPIPSSFDLSQLFARLDDLAKRVDAVGTLAAKTDQDVNDGRKEAQDFRDHLKSQWAAIAPVLLKYVLPAIGAFFSGKALK